MRPEFILNRPSVATIRDEMSGHQNHIRQGDEIGPLILPNIDNSEFNIDSVFGKRFLLSFY